jgi:hypothetical protein
MTSPPILCNRIHDNEHKHAYNNAINALRLQVEFINTIEQTRSIKYLTGGAMGKFVVEVANGKIPQDLEQLRSLV